MDKHTFIYEILLKANWKLVHQKVCSTDSDGGTVSAPSQTLLVLIVEDKEDYEKSWCYCNQLRSAVIMRRKGACTIQWFHCECLRI